LTMASLAPDAMRQIVKRGVRKILMP
jgi:hypothetical protein